MLARCAVQLGVLPNVFVEALEVGEALRLGDGQHLGVEFGHLLQAHLVDLLGRVARWSSADLIAELVARVAVGQRPDAHLGAALGRVVVLHEGREFRVGGVDFRLNGLGDFVAQALSGRRRKCPQEISARGWVNGLFSSVASATFCACAATFSSRNFGGISLLAMPSFMLAVTCSSAFGNLVQPRDVVFVVLHRGEWHLRRH